MLRMVPALHAVSRKGAKNAKSAKKENDLQAASLRAWRTLRLFVNPHVSLHAVSRKGAKNAKSAKKENDLKAASLRAWRSLRLCVKPHVFPGITSHFQGYWTLRRRPRSARPSPPGSCACSFRSRCREFPRIFPDRRGTCDRCA